MKYEIRYGKADVKVYRTHGTPLRGVTPIPESPFAGRDNTLMAAELEVLVHGTAFLDAYTRGDNRLWDPGVESETDPRVKTYADPRPPFGRIGLVL